MDHLAEGPGTVVRLNPQASHHLLVVCRHPRGGRVVLFDRHGLQAVGELVGVHEGQAELRQLEAPTPAAPAEPLHLLLGMPKGPSLDHALRMSVEVGVTEVHLALAKRSVSRSDRSERWQRILDSACAQCGRADRPLLHAPASLHQAVQRIPVSAARFVAVPGAPPPEPVGEGGARALAIGPEGGLHLDEIDLLTVGGWIPTGLGAWTLRTDTAVAVGLALIRRP